MSDDGSRYSCIDDNPDFVVHCVFHQTPTLIVFGELDTNLGAQSHKNLLQLPNHTVAKLQGARHACYMDKPREFHLALLDFLNKLDWDCGEKAMIVLGCRETDWKKKEIGGRRRGDSTSHGG